MGSFALSTSWNAFRHTDAKELLFEIKQLGFAEVELSFNLTSSMAAEAGAACGDYGIRVISCHNYCPIPEGVAREKALPDCFSMASTDEEEREKAVRFTKRTIDTAASLGAKAVVLHCGRVDIESSTKGLIDLYGQGRRGTEKFEQLKLAIVRERESRYKPFLANTFKSLEAINRHAETKGILLGIETRVYYREIPSLPEIGLILNKFRGSNIFYWHDTGHAQLMENLGLAKHKDFLDLYSDKMLGVHFHDISGCSDHRAPSKGDLDFSLLKPYLKKDTLKVIEAHHPATAQDLTAARVYLEEMLK